MTTNINFTLHIFGENENIYSEYLTNNIESLFDVNNFFNTLFEEAILNNIEISLSESLNSSQLYKKNIILNISTQKFYTTPQKDITCSICMNEYIKEDWVSLLKCKHIFHTKCIEEWVNYKQNCPICRDSFG
jgi:hypothetical protein